MTYRISQETLKQLKGLETWQTKTISNKRYKCVGGGCYRVSHNITKEVDRKVNNYLSIVQKNIDKIVVPDLILPKLPVHEYFRAFYTVHGDISDIWDVFCMRWTEQNKENPRQFELALYESDVGEACTGPVVFEKVKLAKMLCKLYL